MSSPLKVPTNFFSAPYSEFYPASTTQQFYPYTPRPSFDENAALDPCCWSSEPPPTPHQTYPPSQLTPANTTYPSVSPFPWTENAFNLNEYPSSMPSQSAFAPYGNWSNYATASMIDVPQTLFAYSKTGEWVGWWAV